MKILKERGEEMEGKMVSYLMVVKWNRCEKKQNKEKNASILSRV